MYPEDYEGWDYRNLEAPNGGTERSATTAVWQTFAVFGNAVSTPAPGGRSGGYDRLFMGNSDEIFTSYVYLAEYYQIAEDRSWVLFKIRDEARWHDGAPITAEDAAFSFDKFKAEGFNSPPRIFFDHIDRWEVLSDNRFVIYLKKAARPSGRCLSASALR